MENGKKISVNSSNLMNKILELVEAHKLFDIPNEKLEILIRTSLWFMQSLNGKMD